MTIQEFYAQTYENFEIGFNERKNIANPWVYAENWEELKDTISSCLEDPWEDIEDYSGIEKDEEVLAANLFADILEDAKRWVKSFENDEFEEIKEWRENFFLSSEEK